MKLFRNLVAGHDAANEQRAETGEPFRRLGDIVADRGYSSSVPANFHSRSARSAPNSSSTCTRSTGT